MKNLCVSSPGKIHLLGEHSVVYGFSALLATVNKRCTITLGNVQGVEVYQKYIDTCIAESFSFFGKPLPENMHLTLRSQIPFGSGMGSSAAIAVSIAGVVSQFLFGKIEKEKVNEIAFRCEKHIHGNPSGGDNTICTYGGLLWYQKNDNGEKVIKPLSFTLSDVFANKFYIINTGRPQETTGEMVGMVREKYIQQKADMEMIFREQGKLVERLLEGLEKGNVSEATQVIQQGENNLEKMGVVSVSTQKLIRAIEKVGSVAKICGAGGVSRASGIVLVFALDPVKVQTVAQKFNMKCEKILLGEEGVRVEK